MSIFKKCAAAAIWTTTATAYLGVGIVKGAFEAMADKVGNGSVTSSSGQTYTGSDFRGVADKCGKCQNNDDGILSGGFRAAKQLWNAD